MIKLLPCDLVVLGSSRGNNFLQCKVRLHMLDPFSGSHISRSFVHRVALYKIYLFSKQIDGVSKSKEEKGTLKTCFFALKKLMMHAS